MSCLSREGCPATQAQPYSPALQAAALWAPPTSFPRQPMTTSPGPLSILSPGAFGPVSEARFGNYGGLNDLNLGPYFDPRYVTTQAPMDGVAAAEGTPMEDIASLPSMHHGPSAFFSDPEGYVPAPKTQFAAAADQPLQVDPVKLCTYTGPCVCPIATNVACNSTYSFSVASLLLLPRNVLQVRDLMEQAGLVRVTRRLRECKLGCGCRIMGGPETFSGFLQFAERYIDTPFAQLQEPRATIAYLNGVYVSEVMAQLRSTVNDGARMNYARAEGARAYLQPRPEIESDYGDVNQPLPAVLPSGVRTTAADTAFASYTLTNPLATPRNRAHFAELTGLPTGTAPVVRPC